MQFVPDEKAWPDSYIRHTA